VGGEFRGRDSALPDAEEFASVSIFLKWGSGFGRGGVEDSGLGLAGGGTDVSARARGWGGGSTETEQGRFLDSLSLVAEGFLRFLARESVSMWEGSLGWEEGKWRRRAL
jgi:hypothetical protein